MKEEWKIFEWPGYHLYQALPPMKAWVLDFPKFGCPLSKMAVVYTKGATSYCVILSEFEKYGKNLFIRVKQKPEIMFKVLKMVDLAAERIFKLGNDWAGVNFIKLSNKELLKYHKKLFYWDEILWRNGQIQNLLEFHNNYLSEYVRELIKEKFGADKVNKYFSILSASNYESMLEKQDRDLLKLLIKAKNLDRKGDKFNRLIKNHTKKYCWMIYGWAGPALEEKYFVDSLSAILKNITTAAGLKNKFTEKVKILRKQENIIKDFPFNDKKLITLLRMLLEAKAKRIDAHSLTYFLGDKIRGEIARRKSLTLNQLRVISIEDTEKIFVEPPDVNKLNEEYDLSVFWYEEDEGIKKLSGKAALKKYQYIVSRVAKAKDADKIKEIKGEVAYIGKVRGRVRLVLSADDFKKFKPGEILVTRITDPNYVPIMKIAKAIITDVGGITCHAAIVSRELRKPCIIGTKIATQVLKDGNLVEVDAERGIVKILK